MNRDAWELGAAQLGALTELIVNHPSQEMIDSLNHAETIGAVIDPTLYRKYLYSDGARLLRAQLEALAECRRKLMEIRADAKGVMATDREFAASADGFLGIEEGDME